MPYIERTRRPLLRPTSKVRPANVGELTYQISCLLEEFRQHAPGRETGKDDFATLAACKVAAISAADEFQRVVIAPYEDAKRFQTGAVHAPVKVRVTTRARPLPTTHPRRETMP